MEKYSVLISLYKKEKPEYLRLALDSMINQTVSPDEIVIVEDGELTDELYAILDEYEKKYLSIKRVKNIENLGLGLSLNVGLKECRNELVARMDTDDISKLDRCEKELDAFSKDQNLSVVGSFVDEFTEEKENVVSTRKVPTEQEKIYEFNKRRSAFNHPSVMYKKSVVLKVGGYSDLRRNQDVDLFGRMLFNGFKAKNIPESLLWFRTDKNLSKRRRSKENSKTYIQVIKNFYKMGYSSYLDYLKVKFAQTAIYVMPLWLQRAVYKFLRRK